MKTKQISSWLNWQKFALLHRESRPAAVLESWLLEQNSLTSRLRKKLGPIEVRKIAQYPTTLDSESARSLSLKYRPQALVREVELSQAGNPCFSAQTLIPKSSLVGETRRLQHWGDRSLGDFLFRSPRPSLSNLEFALFTEQEQLVWGRRRCHYLYNRPIMVCEYFPESSHCQWFL